MYANPMTAGSPAPLSHLPAGLMPPMEISSDKSVRTMHGDIDLAHVSLAHCPGASRVRPFYLRWPVHLRCRCTDPGGDRAQH